MSLGRRLFNAAGHRIRQGIDDVLSGQSAYDSAREELEEHLRRPGPPPGSRPPSTQSPFVSPTAHPYAREYRLLGAPVGSDLKTVQACWRKLVRETHPDRFQQDPEEQQRAGERLRKLNEAYDRIMAYLER